MLQPCPFSHEKKNDTKGQIHKEEWTAAVNDCVFFAIKLRPHIHKGFCPNDIQAQKSPEIRHLRSQGCKLCSNNLAAICAQDC